MFASYASWPWFLVVALYEPFLLCAAALLVPQSECRRGSWNGSKAIRHLSNRLQRDTLVLSRGRGRCHEHDGLLRAAGNGSHNTRAPRKLGCVLWDKVEKLTSMTRYAVVGAISPSRAVIPTSFMGTRLNLISVGLTYNEKRPVGPMSALTRNESGTDSINKVGGMVGGATAKNAPSPVSALRHSTSKKSVVHESRESSVEGSSVDLVGQLASAGRVLYLRQPTAGKSPGCIMSEHFEATRIGSREVL
jgi:hypothetical protein